MYILRRNISYYKDFNKIKYCVCRLGKVEKKTKTIYIDNIAYVMDIETGEILRKKKKSEIRLSIISSINRAKHVVKDIAMSNTWKYFVTLTFNPTSVNRYSAEETFRLYKTWRLSMRRSFPNMKYLCVKELHKDGAIHFHMLVGGVADEDLRLLKTSKVHKLTNEPIYNVLGWKYGFSTAVKIIGENSQAKICNYILKYIGKDFGINEISKKKYWYSKNSCDISFKENSDIEFDVESCSNYTDKELINSKINVYEIADWDNSIDISKTIEYCDFSINYLVLIDFDTNKKYEKFSRLYRKGVIKVL